LFEKLYSGLKFFCFDGTAYIYYYINVIYAAGETGFAH